MRLSFLRGSNSRRNATGLRHPVRSTRPVLEDLEGRQLLSGITYLLINSVHATESHTGSTMSFTVSLSAASTLPVSVHYQTVDGTAHTGTDYSASSGSITFAPGQTSMQLPVSILPQATFRATDSYRMVLSNPLNATLLSSSGNGTIIDPPTLTQSMTIADVAMTRGMSGQKTMIFTISLATASTTPVSVTATTSNLTAIAGVDYQARSQVLTFAPGVTSMQFAVTIYGTPTPTASKIFLVTLSGTTVPMGRSTGAGVLNYGA
jgi:hypothetical protein